MTASAEPVMMPTIAPEKPKTKPSTIPPVTIPDKIPGPDDPIWNPVRRTDPRPQEEP